MELKKTIDPFSIIIIILIIAGLMYSSGKLGILVGRIRTQEKAVRMGHATYTANKKGESKFIWLATQTVSLASKLEKNWELQDAKRK